MRKHRIIQKCIRQFLLLLCTGFYLGHTWADANIITFYITNEGIITTIGLESETIPELTFSAGISAEDHELLFNSPNFHSTSSFLKILDVFIQRHGSEFLQILADEKHQSLPVKIYLAGAGVNAATREMLPLIRDVRNYINVSNWSCLQSPDKKEFHACMFRKKIEEIIPAERIEDYRVEDDMQLMATMATMVVESGTTDQQPVNNNRPILMFHASTYTTSALIDTQYIMRHAHCIHGKGGMFSLGDAFLHMQPITDYMIKNIGCQSDFEKGFEYYGMPAMAPAVYEVLKSCHFRGDFGRMSATMLYNLLVGDTRYLHILGSLVAQIADGKGELPSTIAPTLEYDHKAAGEEAATLVKASVDDLLTKIITFHAYLNQQFQSVPGQEKIDNPQVVLLGEHAHLLTGGDGSGSEDAFRTAWLSRLSQTKYTDSLYHKLWGDHLLPGALNELDFGLWLDEHIRPLILQANVLSRKEFRDYLHRGAIKRLAVLSGNT